MLPPLKFGLPEKYTKFINKLNNLFNCNIQEDVLSRRKALNVSSVQCAGFQVDSIFTFLSVQHTHTRLAQMPAIERRIRLVPRPILSWDDRARMDRRGERQGLQAPLNAVGQLT